MRKYDEMKAFYEKRVEELRAERGNYHDRWFDSQYRWFDSQYNLAMAKSKIELYEQILSKLLDERKNATDMFFMLEGKLYQPVEHTLSKEGQGYKSQPARLSVEFVEVPTDFKKGE